MWKCCLAQYFSHSLLRQDLASEPSNYRWNRGPALSDDRETAAHAQNPVGLDTYTVRRAYFYVGALFTLSTLRTWNIQKDIQGYNQCNYLSEEERRGEGFVLCVSKCWQLVCWLNPDNGFMSQVKTNILVWKQISPHKPTHHHIFLFTADSLYSLFICQLTCL